MKVTLLFLLALLINPFPTYGQNTDARVKRVIAETSDGVRVSSWVIPRVVKSGQDIIVNYKVENRSKQTIYLVRDNTSEIIFEDDELIIFPPPYVPIGGHEPYDYSFTEVARGKTYHSKLVVKGGRYPTETRYAEQEWKIRVGFGYVTDITGLRPERVDDPAIYKGLLHQRIRVLSLDGLIVEMLEK